VLADDEETIASKCTKLTSACPLLFSGYWENFLFWVLSFPGLFIVLSRLISVQYIRESRTIL